MLRPINNMCSNKSTTSLNAHDCSLAIDCFIARRGVPTTITSDNAKTFVTLSDQFAKSHSITWKFITPRAPWQGGFYERLVRSVKVTLKKALGRTSVSIEKLDTLLCQVESVINSRPLTYVSDNANDPQPLTPNHFLLGRRHTEVICQSSDTDYGCTRENLNKRERYRNTLLQQFWQRWTKEYLPTLLTNQGRTQTRKIREGDIVLVHDDGAKKQCWPLGRVERHNVSSDGVCRSTIVRFNGAVRRRAIQRLYPLEVQQ